MFVLNVEFLVFRFRIARERVRLCGVYIGLIRILGLTRGPTDFLVVEIYIYNPVQEKLSAMLEPAVKAVGCDLWGVDFVSQGRHSVLRVYIDREGGVNIDHCEQVSHQVSAVLDVEDPIKSEYTLEVSSPGMDRPLFSMAHFSDYIGSDLHMRLKAPVAGKRKFKAELLQALPETGQIKLACKDDGQELLLNLVQIDKANLVPVF